jgi:hypothetical protein
MYYVMYISKINYFNGNKKHYRGERAGSLRDSRYFSLFQFKVISLPISLLGYAIAMM